jgi:hypothetical protein
MVFAGGEAKAAGNCVVPGDIGTVNFFDETLNYNFMDTCMPVSVANGLIGTINYVPTALGPTGANWPLAQTTLAFDASGTLLLGAGEWKFDKSADRPNPRWDGAALRAEPPVGNLPFTITSTICDVAFVGGACPAGQTLATLVVTEADDYDEYLSFTSADTTIWRRDVVTGTGVPSFNSDLRNVPGPLPILGAGAAFGFSRKLRARIKASRTA